jgi:hypothetical protein
MIKHINKNIPITITVKGIALIISLFLILISNNSNAQKLEAYHPLKEDRTIIERAASAKQMSYNVN